ncbi:MAG: glucoamylase [Hyphomicrobiales bacterium]|nr:glucoamylase [Hyphomicrobiales bacterium]
MTQNQASLDLAVLGNCSIAALVDERANIVWCCIPRLDGDPAFCNLLRDPALEHDGLWQIELLGFTKSTQRYIPNSAILETILEDGDGCAIKIIDFIPRFYRNRRTFRPVSIVRMVQPLRGVPRIRVRLRPRHDYGKHGATTTRGSNHVRYLLGAEVLRLTTDAPISLIQSETPFVLERPLIMVLGADEPVTDLGLIAVDWYDQTLEYWRDWTRQLALPFEWQEAVIRAAITLKLCSYEETGGIVAALTTSVPEFRDSGRNWDYRYCWLRDTFFVVQTLNRLSVTRTMEHYISYITNIVTGWDEGPLQPIFGLGFETALGEREIDTLAGYRGMGPVRIGNGAYDQIQNDGYGSVILAVAQSFFDQRLARPGGVGLFKQLERLGEEAARRWIEPDAGLWEFRTRAEIHTHSSVMCWAACDRLHRIAEKLGLDDRAEVWRDRAERMHAGIWQRAWNEKRSSFVATFDGEDLDGSLLLLQELGFIRADDPRFLSTLAAIEAELREGDHLFRYRRPDDFGPPEISFVICSFWLVEALAAVGRRDEARAIFERLLSHRSSLGLLSEGIEPRSGELWGNFPQSYSMVGMIRAAMRLSRPWEDAF